MKRKMTREQLQSLEFPVPESIEHLHHMSDANLKKQNFEDWKDLAQRSWNIKNGIPNTGTYIKHDEPIE